MTLCLVSTLGGAYSPDSHCKSIQPEQNIHKNTKMKKVKNIHMTNGFSLLTELKNSRNLNMKTLTFNYHKGNTAFYEKLPILHKISPASWSLSASSIIGHICIRRDQSPSGSIFGSNVPICVRLQEI